MIRKGMVRGIKPEYVKDYEETHSNVWPEILERILEWGENLDVLEAALFEESSKHSHFEGGGGQRAEFAIGQLRMMQHAAIQPGLIPLSSEMEEGQADVLSFAQNVFGGMSDARDGFAGDIEHERQ